MKTLIATWLLSLTVCMAYSQIVQAPYINNFTGTTLPTGWTTTGDEVIWELTTNDFLKANYNGTLAGVGCGLQTFPIDISGLTNPAFKIRFAIAENPGQGCFPDFTFSFNSLLGSSNTFQVNKIFRTTNDVCSGNRDLSISPNVYHEFVYDFQSPDILSDTFTIFLRAGFLGSAKGTVLIDYIEIGEKGTLTSIDDSEENLNQIKIFPNPTSDQIIVNSAKPISQYRIYSMVGKTIAEGALENGRVDVSGLITGLYIISLTDTNGITYSQQFLKD